ncbi:peptide-methionine (R)-S-oxide reductase MsrB [Aureibaculum luteum]|uniref:peptide-methionine (R)-S-oxide reductase MsrB n=1 Tax=Aureibaculum luteum TaxID=1548456 RepID=UPI000E545265|nr:peptide-methionine (R)-S-oxide reductase MsrB [Aureibaculum luteum]
MKSIFTLLFISLLVSCTSNAQKSKKENKDMTDNKDKIVKTDAEWKAELTDQEYYVLRLKGTDRPGDTGYTKHFEKGTYVCRACNAQLFKSGSKYESHCGWPSFDDAIPGTVDFKKDNSAGMIRTEITCTNCDGHLGHVFDDGPKETTGQRYCVNTSSIKFVSAEKK